METKKPLSYFLDLIQQPVCICDGETPPYQTTLWSRSKQFFDAVKIPAKLAFGLYHHPKMYDLSKYGTISFHMTQIDISPGIEKILDFDKSNLRCVIVENKEVFNLIKDEAEKLGIPVVGFNREWEGAMSIGADPFDKQFRHPFFDPRTEQIDSSTW